LGEYPTVRHYSDKAAEHQIREAERFVAVGEPLKQWSVRRVFRKVRPMRVDEYVDVNAEHGPARLRPSPRLARHSTPDPPRIEAHHCRSAGPRNAARALGH